MFPFEIDNFIAEDVFVASPAYFLEALGMLPV